MRHRWSLVVLGTSFGAAALAALVDCSLVNDLDALGAGGADSSTLESSAGDANASPSGDARPLPGDPDVAAGDSSVSTPPADAGADRADAAPPNDPPVFLDAATTHWCSAYAASTFCADFDEAPLPSGFTATEGAFISLTSTSSRSSPNDFLLLVPPQDGFGVLASKVTRSFPQLVTTADLSFDINPEKLNTTQSGLLFAAVEFTGNAAAKYSVRLAYNQGVPRVEESFLGGSAADIFHSVFTLPTGAWSRLRLELRFGADGGPSTIGVYVNDVLQGGSKDSLSPPAAMDAHPSLLLGAVYGTLPHNGWTFRYDNVLLDLH